MKIAYIILAHKLPEQVVRLVNALDSPNASFYIHVDRKSPSRIFDQIRSTLEVRPHVHLIDRTVCHWGGFGHVEASLRGLEQIVASRPVPDHAILLTGQDYPMKPITYIEDFFRNQGGQCFLKYWSIPSADWQLRGGLGRIEDWHLRRSGFHIALPLKRRIPNGLRPYGGEAYWSLPRDIATYVDHFRRSRPEFVRFFKHVAHPDEIFYHTVILNSPLKHLVVNNHLRFIDWSQYRAHPEILTMAHVQDLLGSDQLFARKFDQVQDGRVLDVIDEHIRDSRGGPIAGSPPSPATGRQE
jgi:Core-2/I-Branching enzyme